MRFFPANRPYAAAYFRASFEKPHRHTFSFVLHFPLEF
jgi:hypothetical protein